MPVNKDIEGLHGDGFDGSTNEHRIFTDVFCGNDQGKVIKKCVVTGAINFEPNKSKLIDSKLIDALLSPTSKTTLVSSQLNVSNINCLKETSGPGFSPNGHALSTSNDNVANGKHINLSFNEYRLVESTSPDVTSSSYQRKGDVSRHNVIENDEKEISATRVISSPVSQESSAIISQSLKICGEKTSHELESNTGTVNTLNHVAVSLTEKKCTFSGTSDELDRNDLQVCRLDVKSDHSSLCLNEVPIIPQNGLVVLPQVCRLDVKSDHSSSCLNEVPIAPPNGLVVLPQVCRLDVKSDHSSNCLNEVHITPQNGMVVLPESVSPPQDGSTNSQVNGRFISHHNKEMAPEVDQTLQMGSSRRGVRSGSVDSDLLMENINLKTPQAQSRNFRKRSAACLEDGDSLISFVPKKKKSRSSASTCKRKPNKPKPLKKSKTQKGSCRLLPRSLGKRGKQNEGKWFMFGPRTVLSWLINCGTISLKEVIQYRNSKENSVLKEGLITKDGIVCTCCNEIISVSKFKSHAGFTLNQPFLDLVMGSGKPFVLCQLEAWSNECWTRKNAARPVEVEDLDQNDDSCGICGDGGELICCDNCPSTFHQKCLSEQEFPEGNWYCQHCTCRICGDLVDDKRGLISTGAFKCLQCDHKYHKACLKENVAILDVASGGWFCRESCQEIYSGLQSHVGVLNYLSDGFSWSLLRCINGDQKVHSALKAECNSKVAVGVTIMEECFLAMVDARTGIDMIPQVLYNWGSEFPRLNYHGFYSMALEKDDIMISVASIRIHGVTVAEMPIIATCSKYRRQGMCRRLMNSIEQMLKFFKVEKLVITAIPDLVDTWTVGFGFEPMDDHERKSLSHINLMVFPGAVWLKKTMYKAQPRDEETSSGANGCLSLEEIDDEIEKRHTSGDVCIERDDQLHEDVLKMQREELGLTEGQPQLEMVDEGGSSDMDYDRKLSKASCGEELTSGLGECPSKTAFNVDSVAMDDERKLPKMPYEEAIISDQGEAGSQVKVF